MEHPKGKPMVVPANEGRKMFALGNEVRLKLSSSETGGDPYVFEVLTPPGVVVPPHVHRHEDELVMDLVNVSGPVRPGFRVLPGHGCLTIQKGDSS